MRSLPLFPRNYVKIFINHFKILYIKNEPIHINKNWLYNKPLNKSNIPKFKPKTNPYNLTNRERGELFNFN